MNNNFLHIWVLCCILSVSSYPQPARRPAYLECVSSNECSFDSCCVLGMGRYSVPVCRAKLQLYEYCRPASQESVNTTVSYPDGQVASLNNIHMIVCPCADGLICEQLSGRCEHFDNRDTVNEISDAKYQEDD